MAHPSYAPDGEDLILWDLVGDKPAGFFIDVGANDPLEHNVSRSFYEAGWRGINVEPVAYRLAKYRTAQPESANICCALSDEAGALPFYNSLVTDHWATLDEETARRAGMHLTGKVAVRTLAEVCRQHVFRPIDWLKIDVEGWEERVLRGGDWAIYRPEVICIESYRPHTTEPSHEAWEPYLLAQGYELVTAYLLNRFYRRTL
jgi:FkbM family methyltransferase